MKDTMIIENEKFELTTDLVVVPGTVSFDKEEYIKVLDVMTEKYKTVVVTEEKTKEFKKEVANLRSFKKQIEDFRKEQKRKYYQPFEDFENDVKELTSKIDEATNSLTDQLDVFEQERKRKKQAEIEKIEQDLISEYGELEDFEFEWRSDFLNATKKMKDIKIELENQIVEFLKLRKENEEKAKMLQDKKESLEMFLEMFQDKYQLEEKIRYTEVEYLLEMSTSEMKDSLKEIFEQRKNNEIEFKKTKEAEDSKEVDNVLPEVERTITIELKLTRSKAIKLIEFLKENGISYIKK